MCLSSPCTNWCIRSTGWSVSLTSLEALLCQTLSSVSPPPSLSLLCPAHTATAPHSVEPTVFQSVNQPVNPAVFQSHTCNWAGQPPLCKARVDGHLDSVQACLNTVQGGAGHHLKRLRGGALCMEWCRGVIMIGYWSGLMCRMGRPKQLTQIQDMG